MQGFAIRLPRRRMNTPILALSIVEQVTAIRVASAGGCHTLDCQPCTGGSVIFAWIRDALAVRNYQLLITDYWSLITDYCSLITESLLQLFQLFIPDAEPVVGLRELPAGHFGDVLLEAVENDLAGIAVHLRHLRLEARIQAEHVVEDQQLAVRVRPGAEADDRDAGALGDDVLHAVGDHLEQDRERAGIFQDPGVFDDAQRLLPAFALHPKTAQSGDALRRQAEVAHHRDAGVGDSLDARGHLPAAFELHRIAPGLRHEAAPVAHPSLLP